MARIALAQHDQTQFNNCMNEAIYQLLLLPEQQNRAIVQQLNQLKQQNLFTPPPLKTLSLLEAGGHDDSP